MGFGEVRPGIDGVSVGGNRLVELPGRFEGVAEVGVGMGVVRLKADGLVIGAMASLMRPSPCRLLPRPAWASATSGW